MEQKIRPVRSFEGLQQPHHRSVDPEFYPFWPSIRLHPSHPCSSCDSLGGHMHAITVFRKRVQF